MDLQGLKKLGLSNAEVKIFQILLENGPLPASQIILLTGLKKGDTYNKLYDLAQKGLVVEFDKHKTKHFQVSEPDTLSQLVNNRYNDALQAKQEITGILPLIQSTYNLTYNKPGITVFEGKNAQEKTFNDSLSAESDICQYIDSESFESAIAPEIDRSYIRKRIALQVKKRIIMPDTPKNRLFLKSQNQKYKEITEVRFVPFGQTRFMTSMMIYNNTISYLTLKPDSMIGVIMDDPNIALMHRELFEVTWLHAKTHQQVQ